MAELVEVHITYDADAPAQAAAQSLVESRLAACVQVDGPVKSTFWWDGKVQQEPEWRLTAKTTPALRARVVEALVESHPYDLPGLHWQTLKTTPAFADWVANETKDT